MLKIFLKRHLYDDKIYKQINVHIYISSLITISILKSISVMAIICFPPISYTLKLGIRTKMDIFKTEIELRTNLTNPNIFIYFVYDICCEDACSFLFKSSYILYILSY